MMFLHRNIRKYTWTCPDGKTDNHNDHILIDRRLHSSILDVRSFRTADCDNDHYLVVAKFRERQAASKQEAQKLYVAKFNLRRPNELEVRKKWQIKIPNRFATFKNISDSEDTKRAW